VGVLRFGEKKRGGEKVQKNVKVQCFATEKLDFNIQVEALYIKCKIQVKQGGCTKESEEGE
jgi:hypothetical protein